MKLIKYHPQGIVLGASLVLFCLAFANQTGDRLTNISTPYQQEVADSIFTIAPIGEFLPSPSQALEFAWEINFPYNGTFDLSILALSPGDTVPDILPDTGLFFSELGIVGKNFQYPASAFPFQSGQRYAWQVRTTLSNAIIGGPVIFFPRPAPCGIVVSGVPTTAICPGDCFALQVDLPPSVFLLQHQFSLYASHPGLPGSAVTVNGLNVYEASLLCGAQEPPQVSLTSTGGVSVVLQICINEPTPAPLHFDLYYSRPGASCSGDQCATTCCHEVESFIVDVEDVLDYTSIFIEIKSPDPFSTSLLHEICRGDAAHFSIQNLPEGFANPQWQCYDGTAWQAIPDLQTSPWLLHEDDPLLTIDCAASTTGFSEKIFRAIVPPTIMGMPDPPCQYITDEYPLLICCPITPAPATFLTVTPGEPLCEGDMVPFTVELNSPDLFVQTPGEYVDIHWMLNDDDIGHLDETFFTISQTAGQSDLCFKAIISNCAQKEVTVQQCISVSLKPVEGSISIDLSTDCGIADPCISDCYLVCPGSQATLTATGFDNCTIHWERAYSLDDACDPLDLNWEPMGSSSNTVQNTNTIFPPGTDCIYYRVVCKPEGDPSACDPAISNIIKVKKQNLPATPMILVPSTLCKGDFFELLVTGAALSNSYTWFCNGLEVGVGSSLVLEADQRACYWVEADNACGVATSEKACAEVCEVVALISCPLAPNDCACLGLPIELSAADSYSTCDPSDLQFAWSWSSGTANTVSILDTPPVSGETYTLVVTDTETGCTDLSQLTILPCDKN
jgi:hypothetical protein